MIEVTVRNTRRDDVPAIVELCRRVYPAMPSWDEEQILSHLDMFPEGQLVAVAEGEVVGMAASLIVSWDDYDLDEPWRRFTAAGTFANHDPDGRTLYGAEVMVDPARRRMGIGRLLYAARRQLVENLGLARIRAGARIPGYRHWADRISPEEYVSRVERGTIEDPTLSFQLSEGFRVIGVVEDYLSMDAASLGHAVIIEWVP